MGHVKNSLIAIGVVAIALLTSISANASFLIEPHLGYNIHSSTTWGNATVDYNGAQYGARLGLQTLGLMGGFEYNHASYEKEVTASGTTSKADFGRNEMGLFVGYKFPILLRAWLGYNFSAKETQSTGGDINDYLKGSSTEIGIGYTGLPFLSLNLSYKMLSYDEFYNAGNGTTSTLSTKFEPKEIVIGISAPFTLL